MHLIQRFAVSTVFAAALVACGGGSGDTAVQPPDAGTSSFQFQQASYKTGDIIQLPDFGGRITSVSLIPAISGSSISVPYDVETRQFMAPVLPSSLQNSAFQVKVQTTLGSQESAPVIFSPLQIDTDTSGFASLVYVDASLEQITDALSELTRAAGSDTDDGVKTLRAYSEAVGEIRKIIVDALNGKTTSLGRTSSGVEIFFGPSDLAVMDQAFMTLYAVSSPGGSVAQRSIVAKNTELNLQTKKLDCLRLREFSLTNRDYAWCKNMEVSIASNYLINTAGMVGTAVSIVGAAVAIVSVGATLPLTLTAIGLTTVVGANLLGGYIQVASAYGTGSKEGLDTRDNVYNLGQVAAEGLLGQISSILPEQSILLRLLNQVATDASTEAIVEKIDATYGSGGTPAPQPFTIGGTWDAVITRWDSTCGLPSPGSFVAEFFQTSINTFELRFGTSAINMTRDSLDTLSFRGPAQGGQVYGRFSNSYRQFDELTSASDGNCSLRYEATYKKR